MNKGDIATKAQLTARFLLTAAGKTYAVNLGDFDKYKRTFKREGSRVLVAEKGFHRETHDLTSVVGIGWEFTLREFFGLVNEIMNAGTKGADTTQAAVTAPSGTASFNGVTQGASYLIGKYNLNTVVVQVSAATKTLGTDYDIDLGSGELYIIPGGTIANGNNVSVTFGCASVELENYTALDKAGLQKGSAVIHEFDQHSEIPFRTTTVAQVQYWFEGDEEHDGKKPATPTIKIMAITKPVVVHRKV